MHVTRRRAQLHVNSARDYAHRTITCMVCTQMRFICVGAYFHFPQCLRLLYDAFCSQEHKCSEECESNGVCEIDTVPQSIEATFNGAHDRFQYTKVLHYLVFLYKDNSLPCPFHKVFAK